MTIRLLKTASVPRSKDCAPGFPFTAWHRERDRSPTRAVDARGTLAALSARTRRTTGFGSEY
jgi:hypothetical protein